MPDPLTILAAAILVTSPVRCAFAFLAWRVQCGQLGYLATIAQKMAAMDVNVVTMAGHVEGLWQRYGAPGAEDSGPPAAPQADDGGGIA